MASSYLGPVTAIQVGSYFVARYYQILKQKPELAHQFYSDASTLVRGDGNISDSFNTIMQIHTLLTSLHITSVEIETINALDSCNGGVLVMVSGVMKTKAFNWKRKFFQTFFLAPQEKGFFVLNDMFQYIDEGIGYQQNGCTTSSEYIYQQASAPISSENAFDSQLNNTGSLPEPSVSHGHNVIEEEDGDFVNAAHIEDDLVDKYSLLDLQHQQDYDTEVIVEENPLEESPASFRGFVDAFQEPPAAHVDEPVEEPSVKTYASILRVSKGHVSPSIATEPSVTRTIPTSSDWNHVQSAHTQQSDSGLSFPNEIGAEAADEYNGDEGEPKSVYVRNLPTDITAEEIEQEFRNFGRIVYDGIFIRNRKDIVGVCYAFVEFEDLTSVQNAIKASPIQLGGKQVFIEERRPTSSFGSRGGRGRGRGRGRYQTDASRGRFGGRGFGRGNHDQDDFSNTRSNGIYQRVSG